MTIQDRTAQNKRCWRRIDELLEEIDELHELITENMLKIAAEKSIKTKALEN